MNGSTLLAATLQGYDPMGRTALYDQCAPVECGTVPSSTFMTSTYGYDLAGDLTSELHPGGFTLANSISTAQQVSQVTSSLVNNYYPATLATLTYTPFGAVSTLADGYTSEGVQQQETYAYNKRLQPWTIQVGTSGTPGASSCLVYNYYSSWTPPTSCPSPTSTPPSGTGNNGNVMGYWYLDNAYTTFSHAASFGYDNVNRMTSAVASAVASGTVS